MSQASSIRDSQERNTRLENMCWRIWNLTRKKKQVLGDIYVWVVLWIDVFFLFFSFDSESLISLVRFNSSLTSHNCITFQYMFFSFNEFMT